MFHVKHELRQLVVGEETALDAFLAQHADSSMFLRSNLRRAGLVAGNGAYQGVYVAAMATDAILGVVAHFWNGMVVVQAPSHIEALAPLAVAASGRRIVGL